MSLVQLVYVSAARDDLGEEDLSDILRTARNNNPRLGITGMLLFLDGAFLQVIEGPRVHIDALYRKLGLDPRHRGMQCLLREELDARRFPDWSMGFREIEARDAEGAQIFALSRTALHKRLGASDIDALVTLIDTFCGVNSRDFREELRP